MLYFTSIVSTSCCIFFFCILHFAEIIGANGCTCFGANRESREFWFSIRNNELHEAKNEYNEADMWWRCTYTPPPDGCCRWNRYMYICAVYNLPFPKRFENNFCGFVFDCCYYCAKCDYVNRRMRLSRVSLHQAMRLLDFFPSASVSVGVCTRFVYSFSSINSCFCPFYGTIAEVRNSARSNLHGAFHFLFENP